MDRVDIFQDTYRMFVQTDLFRNDEIWLVLEDVPANMHAIHDAVIRYRNRLIPYDMLDRVFSYLPHQLRAYIMNIKESLFNNTYNLKF